MSIVWETQGLTRSFSSGAWWQRQVSVALKDVSISVRAGERLGVIGESGAGKSTLARVGLGLLPADSGSIRLFGESTASWREHHWRKARAKAQLLFQDPRAMLNPYLPIGWVLEESAELYRGDRPAAEQARRALKAVGLAGRFHAYPHQLSGGELRRAGVARLLLTSPKLVVADEPTSGLDAPLKATLLELLLKRLGAECALVLISHDLPLVMWACDRVIVMRAGSVIDEFDTRQVRAQERHEYTRGLLQAAGWSL
jgi:ABC-type glutathione transport system ATPase component